MDNRLRIEKMTSLLETAFSPDALDIIDESRYHANHAGCKEGKGNFSLKIKAKVLNDQSLLQAHRLIYDALGDMMVNDIHALAIDVVD